MPVSQITNEYMRRLPAALRPNPWNIDEEVMALAAKGWSVSDLIAATLADNPRAAGHVVAFLRKVQDQPAPAGPVNDTAKTHRYCGLPHHDPKCQVCWCNGKEEHLVPVLMPDEVRQVMFTLKGFGVIPND